MWPYRSLPRRGFVLFMGATCAMLLLPLSAVLGTAILWVMLPFMGLTIWGLWALLEHSYRSGEILEVLKLWEDRVELSHQAAQGTKAWDANPYWVNVVKQDKGPVEDYLTLRGGPRDVEIGAFLSVPERQQLFTDLTRLLSN
ncbi:DUF2244 domain-containing protein [Actibacterium mucosum]